jgi:Protein NO VEIN, C-terminal
MRATIDASEHGLTEADLERARLSTARSDEERRHRRTELRFGERAFNVASRKDLQELIGAVAASADDGFLRTRPTPARLSEISSSAGGSGGSKGGGGGGARSYGRPKPTDEVTSAIGLAGEVLAYKWLQSTYKETTPDSWVSSNRTFQLGGHLGDDGLGYDFLIARRSETLYFEVKATLGDEYEFDIGESELRAARAARKGWYRIIFIKSVFVPDHRELLVLPNPLELEYMASFAQMNQGMRLRFNPRAGGNG